MSHAGFHILNWVIAMLTCDILKDQTKLHVNRHSNCPEGKVIIEKIKNDNGYHIEFITSRHT